MDLEVARADADVVLTAILGAVGRVAVCVVAVANAPLDIVNRLYRRRPTNTADPL